MVLNVDALQMRRHQLIERKLNYENLHLNPLPNNIWRKLAYGLFAMWINSWNNLGKGCRVVIPSCAVMKILARFPPAGDQQRMGYIPAQDSGVLYIHDIDL